MTVLAAFLNGVRKERGLYALERLMGLLLTTLAIEMFLSGIPLVLKETGG
jgi:small neutral amino acid transporter SnatA (MarC family)